MTEYDYSSDFGVDGVITSSKQGKIVGTVDTMPTPSAEYNEMTLQYVGTTTASFTFGRFYNCSNASGTYKWTEVGGSGSGTVKKVKVNSVDHDPDATGTVDIGTVITAHQDITTKQDKATLETDVSAKGFTKNAGTITGIKMNGSSKGSSGEVDLGTVITDVSGKLDLPGNAPGTSQPLRLPFFFDQAVDNAKIRVTAHTVKLDNTAIKVDEPYTMDILAADIVNNKAGLYVKSIHDTIYADINKRVLGEITSGTGKSLIFNEVDGGGAKFEFTTGSKSFVGVNNDESDIMAQMYALGADNKGVRINITKGKAHYTKGQTGPTVTDSDEIAVVGDFTASENSSTASGVKTAKSIKFNGIEWNLPTGSSGTVKKVKVNGTEYSPDGTGIVDIGEYIGKLGDVTGAPAGTKYRFPYHFDTPVQGTDSITAKFHTLILDDKSNGGDYTITIPSADIDNDKAGLYGKTIDTTLVKYTDVVNNVTSSDTDKPLSANMGKELNARIDNISTIGRFLSTWDCTTGMPNDAPTTLPYAYKSGDYYVVSKTGTVNIRPDGSSYTGAASTKLETETVKVNDIYRYTSSGWVLQTQAEKTVTFSSIMGQPRDNANLAAELDKHMVKLPKETYSGLDYRFPFHIEDPVQNQSNITAVFHTLVLNDGTTRNQYTVTIPSADIAGDKAGLYTKTLAEAKQDALTAITDADIDALAWS